MLVEAAVGKEPCAGVKHCAASTLYIYALEAGLGGVVLGKEEFVDCCDQGANGWVLFIRK